MGCGQVDLGQVPGNDHFAAYTKAREEHFELLHGGVLRLIENDHRIRECTTAHESKGGYLDDAFLHELIEFGIGQHVLQRIVKRLQVRVDFLFHVTRQET